MTEPFGERYAIVYDALYADKRYQEESRYVLKTLQTYTKTLSSVLEFGIGTGLHAQELAQSGVLVAGIDRSEGMIAKARQRLGGDTQLACGDICTTTLPVVCDAVIALFHVASYLTDSNSFRSMLRNAKRHLHPGGVLLFDFWYGPAVLGQRPESRIKEVATSDYEVTRFARTDLDVNRNVAVVTYTTFIRDVREKTAMRSDEQHPMRYFFLPEIDFMLNAEGFSVLRSEEWLTGGELSGSTWNAVVVARAN